MSTEARAYLRPLPNPRMAWQAHGGDPRARSADRRPAPSSLGSLGQPLSARRTAGCRQLGAQHGRDRIHSVRFGLPHQRCRGDAPDRRERVRPGDRRRDRRGGSTKICAGIVSFADLRLPNVDEVLEAQIAAAGGRFRGIRQIAAHDPAIIGASSYVPPPGLMDDPNFRPLARPSAREGQASRPPHGGRSR